jgi:hypothetical protein
MPPAGTRRSPALPWLLSLFGSVSALGILFFVILPHCSGPAGKGGGTWSCGPDMPVVYLCSFLFLTGAVYSMYRLVRIGMEEQGR